jgi:hypothetical protein
MSLRSKPLAHNHPVASVQRLKQAARREVGLATIYLALLQAT